MKRFPGGLVFKAHQLVYHSTLGSRVIKKKKKEAYSSSVCCSKGRLWCIQARGPRMIPVDDGFCASSRFVAAVGRVINQPSQCGTCARTRHERDPSLETRQPAPRHIARRRVARRERTFIQRDIFHVAWKTLIEPGRRRPLGTRPLERRDCSPLLGRHRELIG